jgi:hypothetical protein
LLREGGIKASAKGTATYKNSKGHHSAVTSEDHHISTGPVATKAGDNKESIQTQRHGSL